MRNPVTRGLVTKAISSIQIAMASLNAIGSEALVNVDNSCPVLPEPIQYGSRAKLPTQQYFGKIKKKKKHSIRQRKANEEQIPKIRNELVAFVSFTGAQFLLIPYNM